MCAADRPCLASPTANYLLLPELVPPTDLSADNLQIDTKSGHLTATGDVAGLLDGFGLVAETLTYDPDSHTLLLTDMVLTSPDEGRQVSV